MTLADITIAAARLRALRQIYDSRSSSNVTHATYNRDQQLLGPITPLTPEQRTIFQEELVAFAKNNISLIQSAHEQDS